MQALFYLKGFLTLKSGLICFGIASLVLIIIGIIWFKRTN